MSRGGRTRSARVYQLCCVLAAFAVLLGVAWPMQNKLASARARNMSTLAETQELDSFAMGLLLGGFRGPLVMYVWVNSEEQKNSEQTERLLTEINLIGDLQPQFASMYVHQSWNLAYNISVQYNRENEKYRWVMEGVRFIEKGVRRLPENVEVLSQAGHMYEDKLGESYESSYYRARFRQDSLDSMLDEQRRLRPELAQRWKYIDRMDGPEAQHRWRYGLSVFAIAYDYYKQAVATDRPHPQFSMSVLSSRPAVAARGWLREMLELAMQAESRMWPIDELGRPLPAVPPDFAEANAAAFEEAVFFYRQAQRVAELARSAYADHASRHPGEGENYVTHLNDIALKSGMAAAGERRLTGARDLFAARARGEQAGVAQARRTLQEARATYLATERDIRDYMSTEYRIGDWEGEDNTFGRAPFALLADQAQRAVAQIDRLLR